VVDNYERGLFSSSNSYFTYSNFNSNSILIEKSTWTKSKCNYTLGALDWKVQVRLFFIKSRNTP